MRRRFIVCAVLGMLVVIAYARALRFGYVYFDDFRYIQFVNARPPGMGVGNLRWAFATFAFSNWHPLTWCSYLMDRAVFHENPGVMHGENILLHAMNCMLLFLVMDRSTGRMGRSWMVAALFALHPMHVESVAWIAERKDVLCLLFLLISWWLYAGYVRQRSAVIYGLVLLAYAASLASKATGVTFPILLLIWDWWPLRRRIGRQALMEKVPLLIMAACAAVLTVQAQRLGNSLPTLEGWPIERRVATSALGYVTYLFKLIWPARLSAFYPMPASFEPAVVMAAIVLLLAVSALAIKGFKRRPYLAVGWFWFVVSSLPVIGLMQVGRQFIADRYSYLSSIGIFIALVWGVADVFSGKGIAGRVRWAVSAAVLVACAILTWRQVGYWQNADTLFEHAAAVTDRNWFAYLHLGDAAAGRGDYGKAEADYAKAIEFNPNNAEAYCNLGNCVYLNDPEKAIPFYERSIEVDPKYLEGHINLGNAFYMTGRNAEAAAEYRAALRIDPGAMQAEAGLARSLESR